MALNRELFFDMIRNDPFPGTLSSVPGRRGDRDREGLGPVHSSTRTCAGSRTA